MKHVQRTYKELFFNIVWCFCCLCLPLSFSVIFAFYRIILLPNGAFCVLMHTLPHTYSFIWYQSARVETPLQPT